MPIRNYQEVICDLCGSIKQRELLPKEEPSDGWIQVVVKNPKDLREKLKPVVCADCVTAILQKQGIQKVEPGKPESEQAA